MWLFVMSVFGLGGYVAVNLSGVLGIIRDVAEYLYYSYVARILVAVTGVIGLLAYLKTVGRTEVKYIPLLFIIGIATPVIVSLAYISIGTPITYMLLIFQTATHGFFFWILMGYIYGLVGRLAWSIGLGPAALAYGSSIIFFGVGPLYLYVTGSFLSGLTPYTVYERYFDVEAAMALIGASLSYVLILRFPVLGRMPETVEKFSGIRGIDLEIGGKYPISLAVIGPPGSGRTTLLTRVAATRLVDGDSVAFFAFDDVADHIRERLMGYGCDVASYESDGRLIVVAGMSAPGKPERYTVKIEPQEISIMFSRALADLKPGRKWVLIDSFTTIMDEVGANIGVKLLRTLVAKANVAGIGFLVSFNPFAFTSQVTSLVQDCMEGIVELALQERGGKLSRHCRVVYVEGQHVSGEWFRLY